MNPIHVRYQAALRPESDNALIIRYSDTCCQIEPPSQTIIMHNGVRLKRLNTNIGQIIRKALKITLRAQLGNFLEQ